MNPKLQNSLIYEAAAAPFFDENFIQVLDSHQEYLKVTGNTAVRTVDPRFIGAFIGDFFAVLQNMQISPKYHRIIMRLNGFTNPIQYDGVLRDIFVPDLSVIDRIFSVYRSGTAALKLDIPGE